MLLTCRFRDVMGKFFDLTHEPCLVSSVIDTNIFGMHTEQRFQLINRNHEQSTLTYEGKDISMKYFREKHPVTSSAYVRVMKATVLAP